MKEKLKQNEAIIIQADKQNSIIICKQKDCGEKGKQSIRENDLTSPHLTSPHLVHVGANLTVHFRLVQETFLQ